MKPNKPKKNGTSFVLLAIIIIAVVALFAFFIYRFTQYDKTEYEIFGSPDHMKFRSSMTLFYLASGEQIFLDAINVFFDEIKDQLTINLL
jgi:hypothetical protein